MSATESRIIADFERGRITYRQMARKLKRAAIRRNFDSGKKARKGRDWK